MTRPDRDPPEELSEAAYREASRYSTRYPAFKGTYEFELTFEMLGKRVRRKAIAGYTHTPQWEYYDLTKKALHVGLESSSYHVEVEAMPQEYHEDGTVTEGTRRWVKMGDLIKDALLEAIDKQCKQEDAARRRSAAIKKASRGPSGRA